MDRPRFAEADAYTAGVADQKAAGGVRFLASVIVIQGLLGIGLPLLFGGRFEDKPDAVAAPPPAPVATRVPLSFEVADAVVSKVHLHDSPGVPAAGRKALDNPTFENLNLTFLVLQKKGGWLHVQLPTRPNGAKAWIPRAEVALRTVPNNIIVELGARRLTVLHGDKPLGQFPVAIGKPAEPTPLGTYFVDGIVVLNPDNGVYGAGQLSVTGFSDVHQTFGGGIGQIAIHGTNDPKKIGGTVSAGCVRMRNEDWRRLHVLSPIGTPVNIVA